MPKIYLSPAYHRWNACAISGCDETTHNNLYLDELEVYLRACKIDFKRGTRRVPMSNEDGTALMKKAVKESNKYKPDIHYVSHTNASNGTVRGYRPMIYPNSKLANKLADILIKYRKEIYDQPINLKYRSDLYELYATDSVAYYEEHVFHDNIEDARWFHQNLRKIAEQTCKGFCEYLGIKYVDPYEEDIIVPTPENNEIDVLYQTWDDVQNRWLPNVKNLEDFAGLYGHDVCGVMASLSSGNIIYKVHIKGRKWLPEVVNRTDYAGIYNKPIDAIMIKTDTGKTIHYAVHLRRANKWLPFVTGYDDKDFDNGYAGIIGEEIDAIKIYID